MERKLAHNLKSSRTEDVRLKEVSPFSNWLLSSGVKKGLIDAGFRVPTNVQASAIPVGKMGLDLLIHSKAGTGKTLIFCTILLETCLDAPGLHSLIVVPTREIALQIESVLERISRSCKNFKVISAIGGTDVSVIRTRLQTAKTVVGTPGRLVHLIENGIMKTCDIKLLVLDEADQLYGESHRKNLEFILKSINSERQILACSATFCNDLDKELAKIMRNPLLISTKEKFAILIGIKQFMYELPNKKTSILEMEAKVEALNDIFKRIPFKLCMVFAGSQSRAESYCNYLKNAKWQCELISGALQQSKRSEIFKKFCNFETRILVSTDLMARGIDSEHVNLVINLEPPRNMVTYLHRIGRAGRFGSYGIAITMTCSENENEHFQQILNEIGSGLKVYQFPKISVEGEDENFWDPTTFNNESSEFNTFIKQKEEVQQNKKEEITILRSQENKKENNYKEPNILCSAEDSNLSINTNTFCVDSKDSAVNLLISPVPENKENLLLCQPEDTPTSNRSSMQLSANTIDDASSIAVDSQYSVQQDLLAPCPSLVMDHQTKSAFGEIEDFEELKRDNILQADIFSDYCADVLNTPEENIKNENDLPDSFNSKYEKLFVKLNNETNNNTKVNDDFFASYLECETEVEEEKLDNFPESSETTVGDDFSIEKQDTSMQVCVDSAITADIETSTNYSEASKNINVEIVSEECITGSKTYLEETICLTNGSCNADSEPSENMIAKDEDQEKISSAYFFNENPTKNYDESNDNNETEGSQEDTECQNEQNVITDEEENNNFKISEIWMNEYWNQVNFIQSYTKYMLDYSKNCKTE